MASALHDRLAAALRAAGAAGGYGPLAGAAPEPEPTAVASLALDDADARAWLTSHQRADGRFTVVPGPVQSTAATALAALALDAGAARRRALTVLPALKVRPTGSDRLAPHDPATRGWGWTPDTAAWIEPTAWAVLALRRLQPNSDAIADGVRVLKDRECVGGGWNYGNRVVYDVDLKPFVHTTAVAVIALQSVEPDVVDRGRRFLVDHWRDEAGGLTLALTLAAFSLTGGGPTGEVADALAASFDATGFLGNVLTTAWATLATGPGLERLRVPERG
jgi:hypothetical protein